MTWQSCFCKRLFRSTSTWLFKSVKTLHSPVVNLRELILPFNSPIFEIEIETQFTSRLFLLRLKFAFCNSGRLLRIVCRSGIWEKMNCLYSVLGDNQMSVVSETRFTSRLVLLRHLEMFATVTRARRREQKEKSLQNFIQQFISVVCC